MPGPGLFTLRQFGARLAPVAVLAAAVWASCPAVTYADGAGMTADWEKYATPKADKIVIYKAARRLELVRGNAVIKSYHIALGRRPFGQKTEAGDGRTPEGTYYIDSRNLISDYHLALHISYPDEADIERATAHGVAPGGAIMIHGAPNDLLPTERLAKDWTAGCIALTNAEIEEVSRLVDDGVTVEINP
jgi:murein L,D-transpeptidase YafK